MDQPPSLSQILTYAKGVRIYCTPCNRSVTLPGWKALALYGPDANVLEIARRSRCVRCGARSEDARPELPGNPATGGHGPNVFKRQER